MNEHQEEELETHQDKANSHSLSKGTVPPHPPFLFSSTGGGGRETQVPPRSSP